MKCAMIIKKHEKYNSKSLCQFTILELIGCGNSTVGGNKTIVI